MYANYANKINQEDLLYEQFERTSDIQMPQEMNYMLLAVWVIICLIGFGIILLTKKALLGIIVIAIPTFFGMVIKPTFGLCIMMLVLPTGGGIGLKEVFSLDRGVGIAVTLAFALNLLISRARLRIRSKALWVIIAYTMWILLISLTQPYIRLELSQAFTQLQLLVLIFVVYWILETNGEKTFRWALRSYVVGTLGTIILAYVSGKAMTAIEETPESRYAATLGQTINANMLAVLVSMAFLAAIYLLARDKNLLLRIIYLIALLFLPIMLLRIASRGALVALAIAVLSPFLFVRQVLRRPALAALVLVTILLISISLGLLMRQRELESPVAERLTRIESFRKAIDYRVSLGQKAIESAIRRPTGTGYFSWPERSGEKLYPHTDLFFVLGLYGFPGVILLVVLGFSMIYTIKRTPMGLEKLYIRSVLIFLILAGLSHTFVFKKFFWVFLAFVMAGERIAYFFTEQREVLDSSEGEELAGAPTAY